ncbi:VOC family protein [Xanthobacter autotrophicus]|uniref:VOC family protein n=1 Tax=Xanthobacter autotrophicus TaxID=280 RepID=UPI0024A72406|nr:VOC family protein [Xanthobacter autotrophicus]MDI4657030.1 VOC family protein [Xanthobacter autotrophicus]
MSIEGGQSQEMAARGLPGLRGTDHIGFTVPDIDEAVRFFVEVIGCIQVYELGPFQAEDDWMARQLNVDPRTIMKKLVFLRCGFGSNFEIFQYIAPEQRTIQPRNSDVGGHHLAFYVDDMNAAVRHLEAHGARICGAPVTRESGPSGGQTWVYFLTPWGMQCELVSFPDGKAYERTTALRLWHTADPGG